MLQTLLKIGEWQSQGKSKWDRFLDYPKAERKDKLGNPINNYTLPIIFDLDAMEVIISSEKLREYDEKDVRNSLGNKMKGSNSKAICSAGLSKRLGRINQSFFGKEGVETKNGELIEAIEKENSALLSESLKLILSKIFDLKEEFLHQTVYSSTNQIDIRALNESFDLAKNENIIFLSISLKSEEFGYREPTLFADIPDYRTFLEYSFFGDQKSVNSKKTKSKLCYASGELGEDVEELNLSTRYSLNKMFVTETKNYAAQFNKKKFPINYQVSIENQEKLDYASDYLLNHGYRVKIANLEHVILPQFQQNSNVDLEMALEGIHKKSDLLFNINRLNELAENVNLELDDQVFWINFIAFESDGKFFKSTEIIKDVSSFHFSKILQTFTDIDWKFREAKFIDWDKIMTEFDYSTNEWCSRKINFNSLFQIIPIRKDKEKKNKALELFKTILENRKINGSLLFDYFSELILCHYYERYRSYTNVKDYSQSGKKNNQDYLKWAIRDSVFKYHAFIQLLKKLNLIDMEQSTSNATEGKPENKYDQAIDEFFIEMDMTHKSQQKAMFYLGRMLHAVENIQLKKQIKKTVIHLVNFNGLDGNSILRLRNDLINKARQHNQIGKVKFLNGQFGDNFKFNSWNMDPNEALFFVLTGYSFRVSIQESEEQENIEKVEETL
ncbi:CRISPR-associated protein [Zunongwangia profunda SM-A87]|uniref:CRISPR-associated protein n=1 Tax=Zunongwangia profunda (strain DSM 18752 / CCTCC AB 206139 / SM-A87) TaxID=655815 RepID=D5BKW2_ZUNPS|nr:TM1802 family CRISPR-associated protein [Zunongwangia profunda]ADF51861.1 CRISPR-associated protein [Zunongwangia profunda SM-A87]